MELTGGEEVMAATESGAAFGVAPFWIRHCGVPFDESYMPVWANAVGLLIA